jgi:hypothetical protein
MPQTPLWEIDFSDEARGYFLDNDPYTFELLAQLFRLTYYTDPLTGTSELSDDPGTYALPTMNHTILFTFTGGLLYILAAKPD